MVEAEESEGVLDGVATLDTEEDGEFICGAGGENFFGRSAEGELGGMAADLLADGIEEGEGAEGVARAGTLRGIGPEGEELGGEIAAAGGGEIEMAGGLVRDGERRGEVPRLVDEALWSVGVGVDDEGGGVDGGGVGRDGGRVRHFA